MKAKLLSLGSGVGCGTLVMFALTVGALTFNYCVNFIFGIGLPWYGNLVGGLLFSEVTVPLAIVLWLLSLGGVHGPLIK